MFQAKSASQRHRILGSASSIESLEIRRLLATIIVTTTADDISPGNGTVSLREAITAVNAGTNLGDATIIAQNPGAFGPLDHINFNIPGTGVKAINVGSDPSALAMTLPSIKKPVVLDGYTQGTAKANTLAKGDNAVLLIELNGASAGAGSVGIDISAGSSTVRGLAINRFSLSGISLDTQGGSIAEGNFIGTDSTGTIALPNQSVGIFISAPSATIGGSTPAARNIISGNLGDGVYVNMVGDADVRGNFIGLAADGLTPLGNKGNGVFVDSMGSVSLGGTSPGEGNVISGNTLDGVNIGESVAARLEGNIIGLAADGVTPAGNMGNGVSTVGGGFFLGDLEGLFGTPDPAARNVISGNGADGVHVADSASKTGTALVIDDYIGTDISGTKGARNQGDGINFDAKGTLIVKNCVISNNSDGIHVGMAEGALIQGNFIGTDRTGKVGLPNATGIVLDGTNGALIGGAAPALRNIISGNGTGIRMTNGATLNTVQGNYIGVDATGVNGLPQFAGGISIDDGATNNIIGGSNSSAGNIIAFGVFAGVQVQDAGTIGNSIRYNQIFSNAITGIGAELRLGDASSLISTTLPNDPGDVDTGPNNQQNFPLLASAVSQSGNVFIQGFLNSNPNTTFLIDFYSSPTLDAAGHGEARAVVGTSIITTDGSGNANINVAFPSTIPGGQFIIATATTALTAPYGDTSEFSPAISVIGPPAAPVPPPPSPSSKVSIVTDPCDSTKKALKIEGTDNSDTITVTKSGSSQGKVVVKINNVNKGTFSFTGSILVYGKKGNDNISIDSAITRTAFIFGGDGKDTESGGGGSDVLVGNAADDDLKGNSGRDLLFGGGGADKLDGGALSDILVAGDTVQDDNLSTLCKLLDEWKRTDRTYDQRVAHITGGGGLNGSVKLNAGNVFSSAGLVNHLIGGSSTDLFFAAVPGDVTDKVLGETVVDIG